MKIPTVEQTDEKAVQIIRNELKTKKNGEKKVREFLKGSVLLLRHKWISNTNFIMRKKIKESI